MALEEACEYGLLSRDTVTASNISCVHVKLTDSALKVIEDLKNGNRFVRPTIEVSDEQGVIRIPDGSGYKEFIFSVSPLAGDLNGSFDCIKQAKNGKLETLDTMSQKIVVKATDDVYKTTKEKLAVKNEESMKSRAKEIDQTKGGVKSKKVTKTIRNGATIAASRTSNSSQSNIKSTATTRNDWSPSTRSPNSLTPASSQNTSPPLSSTVTTAPQANNATYTSNKTAAKKLDQLKRKQQSKKNSVAKEAALAHNKTSGPTKSEKEKLKAALLNVPLRERIVHLLGAKPNQYNTPSVILRLKSEGLNPAMENSASADISRILETVAVSNSKSCWSLKDKFVNELDANWGFYTDTDKQLVSRLLARAPKPKPIVAVHPTHPNQPDTSKRKKDIESDSDDDFPMTKKEKYIAVQGENELTQSDTLHHSTENPPMNEDFLTSYPPPTKQSTRDKYRNDFNSEYEEYQTLLAYEGQLTKQFSDLQKRREKLDPQSDKFLRLDKKITRKYEKVNKDGKHKDRQERLAYLHRKLSHIKALVQEWDYVSLIQGQRPPPLAPHRPRAVVLPESTN